ncbi:MAG: peptide/nickel transport system permease protein, partial [Chloroflexota bacterium]|nr:peptide/nickel transport system permease protein [Chloroflexota bacterium]
MSAAAPTGTVKPPVAQASTAVSHPIRALVARRLGLGVITVFVVSAIVYFATHILPGDAATAILGQQATPERLALLRHELGLDQSAVAGYVDWVRGAFTADFGDSLTEKLPVTTVVGGRLANSAVLIIATVLISTILGILAGVRAAFRRDGFFDSITSVIALVFNALPEFVVGILMVVLFAVNVFQWFPALSILPPGGRIWSEPDKLVLPVLTLVLVITPYTFRMVRAAMIEALGSDYIEV